MLQGTGRAPKEVAPVGSSFSSTDYLSDAHFHMHQLVKEHNPNSANCSVSLLSLRSKLTARAEEPSAIPLRAALDSCMLSSQGKLPGTRASEPWISLCIGAHPLTVRHWNDDLIDKGVREVMCRLVECSSVVVAVGEVGLDFHPTGHPPSSEEMSRQKRFLTKLLTALLNHSDRRLRELPLVLHVRDQSGNLASSSCLQILRDVGWPREGRIYRHSFLGNADEAGKWLDTFPNTVFGVGPKAMTGSSGTIDFFKSVPARHLLVESDAPYQAHVGAGNGRGRSVPSPLHVGTVYRWLAEQRRSRNVSDLTRVINETFQWFVGATTDRPQ